MLELWYIIQWLDTGMLCQTLLLLEWRLRLRYEMLRGILTLR